MRILFIAVVSALFFAYVITELFTRLWPGQYVALLVLSFIALLVSGLLNLRLAGWLGTAGITQARAAAETRRTRSRSEDRDRSPAGQRDRQAAAGRSPRNDNRPHAGAPAPAARGEPAGDLPRESGTVKWFNRTKGFGFVIRESGEEIFVHQRSIRMTGEGDNRRRPALRDGQSVTFVVAEREKGLQAEDVVPAD